MTMLAPQPLTHEQVHHGMPCDCVDSWRRIERRELEDRRSEDRGSDRRES